MIFVITIKLFYLSLETNHSFVTGIIIVLFLTSFLLRTNMTLMDIFYGFQSRLRYILKITHGNGSTVICTGSENNLVRIKDGVNEALKELQQK